MLCIKSRKGESIVIRPPGCEPIHVHIVERQGTQVLHLGFSAPMEVEINRLDVDQRKYPNEYA